jgi:hypothetical protein
VAVLNGHDEWWCEKHGGVAHSALNDRLAAYFRRNHSTWISSGDIQRIASAKTTYMPSNLSRQLRELKNEGVLEVRTPCTLSGPVSECGQSNPNRRTRKRCRHKCGRNEIDDCDNHGAANRRNRSIDETQI